MWFNSGMSRARIMPALLLALLVSVVLTSCSSGPAATATPQYSLGQLVTAKGLGDKNAPQNVTDTFNSTDTVYAVVNVISFPSGHKVFSRWTPPSGKIEDTDVIVANQNYSNTNLEFHISGENGQPLETGQYRVQLYVDGNPDSNANTTFTVK